MENEFRILVVDDERMYRTLLQKTLAEEGYQVTVAEDGNRAAELIEAQPFDLVLTDLAMPGLGGIDVLRFANRQDPKIKVIIVTGFASLDTALAAIREGVYDYVTKPFQLEEIKITVGNAAAHVLLAREREVLAAKLAKAYETIEELSKNDKEFSERVAKIDDQLSTRQKEINDGMRRLRGFHDRVLPVQFRPPRVAGAELEASENNVVEKLRDAKRLLAEGAITDQEFRTLKRRILAD
jgi:CheY-like chemotaxis protein